ncbi:hypothetical protein [Mycoplasmopsis arginini]|uniref:hypothetical protein n=1 Tax=Mycoplasmopsis arginini TaxID=2094 RepID=UPI00249F406C|nr:hypothetical protein [Mycoplasmopsis arginini]
MLKKDSQFCNINKDTTLKNNHVNSNNSTNEIGKKEENPWSVVGLILAFFFHY